jgi:hypothetical protein
MYTCTCGSYAKKGSKTDLSEPILVPEKLAYPSSILGYVFSLPSPPDRDFIVEVELVRRSKSGRSSIMLFLLAKLPYRLEPGATDGTCLPQSLSS